MGGVRSKSIVFVPTEITSFDFENVKLTLSEFMTYA